MRKRDNSLMDRGQTTVSTDANGYYSFEGTYPLGEFGWTVMEAYSDSFYTTGVTYQADNQPTPTTVKGAGVDVSTLQHHRPRRHHDWGVHAYDTTGATASTRATAASSARSATTPPATSSTPGTPPRRTGSRASPTSRSSSTTPSTAAPTPAPPATPTSTTSSRPTASYKKGKLLNTYLSENWERPTGCTARDLDGGALVHGVDEDVLALDQETDGVCIPAFSQSVQFGTYAGRPGHPGRQLRRHRQRQLRVRRRLLQRHPRRHATRPPRSCNGGDFDAAPRGRLPGQPGHPRRPVTGNPMYKVTGEEDINIGNGNQIVPQVPPPACAGALHTVDCRDGTDG